MISMWGGRALLHMKNDGFSPLDKMEAPSSDQSGSGGGALFLFARLNI